MKCSKVLRYSSLLTIVLSFISLARAGEEYTPEQTNPLFENWRWKTIAELSDKGVRCQIEGSDNSIWFGTGKGVFYYDGLHFKQYHDENEILSSPIYGLCLTSKKVLYAVSLKGICHFSDGLWTTDVLFPATNVLGNEWEILNIVETTNGNIWVALYFGLFQIRNGKITLFTDRERVSDMDSFMAEMKIEYLDNTNIELNNFIVYDILEDSNDKIWLALEDGRILKIKDQILDLNSPQSYELYSEEDRMILGRLPVLFETSDGTILNLSQSVAGGVNTFDPVKGQWTSFRLSEQFGGDNLNYSILETDDGTLWIGGLARLFTCRYGIWNEYRQPELEIPQTRILLLHASDGSLWISGLLSDVYRVEYQTPYCHNRVYHSEDVESMVLFVCHSLDKLPVIPLREVLK